MQLAVPHFPMHQPRLAGCFCFLSTRLLLWKFGRKANIRTWTSLLERHGSGQSPNPGRGLADRRQKEGEAHLTRQCCLQRLATAALLDLRNVKVRVSYWQPRKGLDVILHLLNTSKPQGMLQSPFISIMKIRLFLHESHIEVRFLFTTPLTIVPLKKRACSRSIFRITNFPIPSACCLRPTTLRAAASAISHFNPNPHLSRLSIHAVITRPSGMPSPALRRSLNLSGQ
jgi:hypothetical protein